MIESNSSIFPLTIQQDMGNEPALPVKAKKEEKKSRDDYYSDKYESRSGRDSKAYLSIVFLSVFGPCGIFFSLRINILSVETCLLSRCKILFIQSMCYIINHPLTQATRQE